MEKFPYIQIVMIRGVSVNIDKSGNTDCSILLDLMKRDLQQYMKDCNGVIDRKEILKMVKQMSETLFAFKEYQLIYGDIKPKNVLLNFNNDANIADFDSAKISQNS